MRLLWCIVMLAVWGARAGRRYDGYQAWRLQGDPANLRDFVSSTDGVLNMADNVLAFGFDFVDLLVPSDQTEQVGDSAKRAGVSVFVTQADVQTAIDEERETIEQRRKFKNSKIELTEYHTFEEIEEYLQELAATYDNVTLSSVGQTYEGRDLWVVRVGSSDVEKPAIWVDCGIHAREWITPATCLWILSSVTTQYGVDEQVTQVLDMYDIHMMPVMNPDGYVYTWTDDRLWRKNRLQVPSSVCFGVDLNRNYNGTNWGGIGASDSPCQDTYHGEYPFSEPETAAVSAQMLQLASRRLYRPVGETSLPQEGGLSQRDIPRIVLSERTVSEEILPQETVPEEILPQETVPEEILPQETVDEEIHPQKIVRGESIPYETLPEKILSQETVPEEILPLETVPEEILPQGNSAVRISRTVRESGNDDEEKDDDDKKLEDDDDDDEDDDEHESEDDEEKDDDDEEKDDDDEEKDDDDEEKDDDDEEENSDKENGSNRDRNRRSVEIIDGLSEKLDTEPSNVSKNVKSENVELAAENEELMADEKGAELTGENEAELAEGNGEELVGGMEAELAEGNGEELVGGKEAELAEGNGEELFGGNEAELAEGNGEELVGGKEAESTEGNGEELVGGNGEKLTDGKGTELAVENGAELAEGNGEEFAEGNGLAISFSLHSYGALWLYAYGYTADLPPDHEEMERVSAAGVAGIASVNGSVYTPGPHYTTIYPSTGTVVDYGYEHVRLPHTYIIESLSDGYGFLLPESLVAVTAEEVWRGMLAAVTAL